MTYILENLYLGSVDDAYNTDYLKDKLKITHLLTLNNKPIRLRAHEPFTYKWVNVLDEENEDLLKHLEECVNFISAGRQAGAILVHCFAGRSRSATAVLAYMMKTFDISLEESLKMLRCQRPEVCPNDGFMFQLQLYHKMGCSIDTSNSEYKKYCLEKIVANLPSGSSILEIPENTLVDDPALINSGSDVIYRCRKCRRALLKKSSVIQHAEGHGDIVFSRSWHFQNTTTIKSDTENTSLCDRSLFTEPILWMKEQISKLEGKLTCPKCQAKLGSFNWYGERCPCGEWITPAFHVSNSKVDQINPSLTTPRHIERLSSDLTKCTLSKPTVTDPPSNETL